MIRIFIIVLCVALIAWMDPAADKTKEGNRLYHKELYDEATEKYTDALIELPNSPRLHFNIGNAAYKKGDHEEAIKSYTKAASLASNPILESKALYNLANCKYRQGELKESVNPDEAISFYKEALNYYEQALDRDSGNANAKYNHEFIARRFKKSQQEQQQQKGQEEQQQQGQQEKQEEQEGEEGEQKEQQEQKNQSEGDDESESEEKNAGQEETQEEQEGEQKSGQQDQKKSLTAKEAKMLLDSLKDEELRRPDQVQKMRRLPQVLRDW